MDPAALTSLIMGILTPLLPLVGDAIVSKVGEDVYHKTKEQAKRLYEAIRKRFAHEQDGDNATQALQTFASGDADFVPVVQKKLFTLLQNDPTFFNELSHILQSSSLRQRLTTQEEAQARRIRMSNTLGRGEQEIDEGRKSIVEDVHFSIGNEKPAP